MERFICIDIGDKRIGIAVSDPFNTYALPVKTYFRKNLRLDLAAIVDLAREKCATAIVCGRPVNFDGTESIQTKKADFFIEKIKENFNGNVFTVDERLTTVEAEEVLIDLGKSRQERKQVIDALAAANILEGFLNEKNFKEKRNMCDNEKKCTCGCEEEGCDCEKETCNCSSDCDCGCQEGEECTCGSQYEDEEPIVLTTDDGKKYKVFYLGTVELDKRAFVAFEPAEEIEGISEDEMIIFELKEGEGENDELLPIEDDDLLDKVYQEFLNAMAEEE